MSKNKIASLCVVALIILGGSFYGGMAYQKTRSPALTFGNFAGGNLTDAQRQQFMQNGNAMGRSGGPNGGNFANGEVISKDDQSITVKTPDGSTKIVFLAGSTTVSKNAGASKDDVIVGTQVTVIGTTNSDGSVTAQSVQIRPADEPINP